MKRYHQGSNWLLYDSDGAGIRAALRAIPILREAGVTSRVVSLKPWKDPDEFIKNEGAEAFEERLNRAMDSFMFRVHIAEQEFAMDAPQGQNQFFERCAGMLLELSDELERNLYIEAIVKEYGRYGVGTEDIRKRVNTLALKGTPAEKRIQPKSGTPETKKNESAADKAQKLMLTWLVNYPGIFEQVEKYISPSDFVVPLYKEVAQMLFDQHKEGETNPGKLLNAFQTVRSNGRWHLFLTPPFIWKTKENSRGLFPMRCFGSRKKASKKKTVPGIRQTWPGFRN